MAPPEICFTAVPIYPASAAAQTAAMRIEMIPPMDGGTTASERDRTTDARPNTAESEIHTGTERNTISDHGIEENEEDDGTAGSKSSESVSEGKDNDEETEDANAGNDQDLVFDTDDGEDLKPDGKHTQKADRHVDTKPTQEDHLKRERNDLEHEIEDFKREIIEEESMRQSAMITTHTFLDEYYTHGSLPRDTATSNSIRTYQTALTAILHGNGQSATTLPSLFALRPMSTTLPSEWEFATNIEGVSI